MDLPEIFEGRKRIGVCGSADSDTDLIKQKLADTFVMTGTSSIAVICGGTRGGIPELVEDIARELSIPVCGVMPACGEDYALSTLTHAITVNPTHPSVPSTWGSEASTLIGACDAVIFIGGGWGTIIEAATVAKINASRLKKKKTPIYVVLTNWDNTQMLTDQIFEALLSDPNLEEAVCDQWFSDPYEIACFLTDKLW